MRRLDRLLALPLSHPRTVLAAVAAATLVLGLGLVHLRVDSSIESMIVEHDPDRIAFERWKAVFGSDEVVAIALPFDDALAAPALDVQRRIAERIAALPEVAEVDALVTVDDVVGDEDLLDVERLVPEDPADWTPAAIERLRARVEANPIWTGFLVSADRRTAALQVRLHDPGAAPAERGALVEAIDRIVVEEAGGQPYYLAGHPFMKTEIARTMQRDFSLFVPVTVLVMAVLVRLSVGSIAMTGLILLAVLVSVIWMTGVMGWIGEPITALSNTAPTFLLAIGCAYVMHLAASYQRLVGSGMEHRAAVRAALARVRRPVVVAGLTTAIGAGFVATSDLPLVRGFGIDLVVGVLAVIALACFGIPAALALLPIRGRSGLLTSERRFGILLFHICGFVARHPRGLLAGAIATLLVAGLASTRIVVDSSGPKAFAEDSRFRQSSEFYRAHFSGDVIENVYLRGPAAGAFHDPDRLRRMLAFQAAAEALPEIDRTLSIANHLELINRAMHGDDPAELRIPDSAAAVAQYLLLYSSAGEPDEFDDLLDFERREARIVLTATVASSRESAALRARLEQLARIHFPAEAGADAVLSTEILLSEAADELALEQVVSLGGAGLLILLLSSLAFRSAWIGAHLFLPISLPVALNFAVMALLGVTLRDVTSVIAVTTLGIAVDSTVHLLDSVRRSETAQRSRRVAVVEGFVTTGRPLVVTSLIIASGLAVLGLSNFAVISNFGGLEALSLLFALVADLVVLPAQLLASGGAPRKDTDGAGDPVLVSTATRSFPALLLGRRANRLLLRRLGDPESETAAAGEPVDVRALDGRAPRHGSIVCDAAHGDNFEIELAEPAARFAEFFLSPQPKEFRFGGYRFRIADSIDERRAAYELRFRVYAAQGYIDPGEFETPVLRDALDEIAVQCLAYDPEGRLVGTVRAVLPNAIGYHTEALFAFVPPDVPREQLGEIGRLALDPAHRGGQRIATIGLVKLLYDALREHVTHVYAFMPPALIESLSELGFTATPLTALEPTAEMLRRRWSMRRYFADLAPEPVVFEVAEVERNVRG